MKSPIKEFHIVFENCDCIKIPVDVIENFSIYGITESWNMWSYSEGECLGVTKRAKECRIDINLNKAFQQNIGIEEFKDFIPVHERIKNHSDITHYYVYLEDGTEYSVLPPWEGDNQYKNEAQKHESWEYTNREGLQQVFCVYHGFEFQKLNHDTKI